MENYMKRACVFCGSSIGKGNEYLDGAERLGKILAERGVELVYGGANVGLMGMVAESCLKNNGSVFGVIPRSLVDMGVAHDNLTELKIVDSMHERKAMMEELSDCFISLPGGIGTIEETFEIFTWMQLGMHSKPIGILNINNFYDNLMLFLRDTVDQGFLRQDHLDMLIVDPDPEALVDRLENYSHVSIEKWFDRDKNKI